MGTVFNPPQVPAPPPGLGPWIRAVESWIRAQTRISTGRIGVSSSDLAPGAISQGAIAPQALDGFLITAPFIQSSDAGSGRPRYQLDEAGYHSYDEFGNLITDLGLGILVGSLRSAQFLGAGTGTVVTGANALDGSLPAELVAAGYSAATLYYTTLDQFTATPNSYMFDAVQGAPGGTVISRDLGLFFDDGVTPTLTVLVNINNTGLNVNGTLTQNGSPVSPTGAMVAWSGPSGSPPAGWLIVNGAAVSRTTYATLFALIGTTYGVGDGSTTFNLPPTQGYSTLPFIIKT